MEKFPTLSNKEAFILSYLTHNEQGYGLAMVRASSDLLKQSTVYVTLQRMTEKGYLNSWKEEEEEPGPPKRIYEVTKEGTATYNAWRRMVLKIALQPVEDSDQVIKE
ncbi:MAG: PadR family transcriptional regulator [Rhodothermales bacterium]